MPTVNKLSSIYITKLSPLTQTTSLKVFLTGVPIVVSLNITDLYARGFTIIMKYFHASLGFITELEIECFIQSSAL